METRSRRLLYYIARNGSAPFLVWLELLPDIQGRARIQAKLDRLQTGNPGDVKGVGHGVMELRVHHGPGYRVYFAQKGSSIVVLLWGGTKKGQERDVRTAISYWEDYLESKAKQKI